MQHASRGVSLECSPDFKFTPNQSAVEFSNLLKPQSAILEVGSANGRDARFWASQGHMVIATDFSEVAMQQLTQIAIEQGISEFITPILWDISQGRLPPSLLTNIVDGFYARSALHIGDTQMYDLAFALDKILKPGGIVFIEGKGPNDEKVARSEKVGRHLAVDNCEGGHLRRVWTCRFSKQLCSTLKWDILDLSDRREKWNGTPATFMRLIARKGIAND